MGFDVTFDPVSYVTSEQQRTCVWGRHVIAQSLSRDTHGSLIYGTNQTRILLAVVRPSIPSFAKAFITALVVTGCTATVQPIRLRTGLTDRSDASHVEHAPTVSIDAATPDLPAASCPDAAPPPVADSTAKFVLQNGHEGIITHLASSADGRILASAGMDGTLRIWDVRHGILLRKLGTAGLIVAGLSLSSNGKRLAYYAPDGTPQGLVVWIVDLDKPAAPRSITQQYGTFELSPDGKKLAIATDKLMVFDVDSGTQLLDMPLGMKSPTVLDVAFDAAQNRIGITTPGEAAVVDAVKGTVLHRLTTNYSVPYDVPSTLIFTGDRVLIRSAMGIITQHALAPASAPITLAGKYKDLAVVGDRLWASDMTKNAVVAFSLPNLTPIKLPAVDPPNADLIAASADGSTVAFAHSGRNRHTETIIDARDAATMRPVRTIEGRVLAIDALALNPTGDALVTSSVLGEVGMWDLRDGSRSLPLAEAEQDRGRTVSMDYAPNGGLFVSTSGMYAVRARDAKTGRTKRLWTPKNDYHVRFTGFIPHTSNLITVAMRTEKNVSPTKKLANGMPQVDETFDVLVDRWDLSGPIPEVPLMNKGQMMPPSGTNVGRSTHQATHAVMSPQGDLLALEGTYQIALMRLDTGAIRWVAPLKSIVLGSATQPDGALDHHARWMTFSPDGKSLLLSTQRRERNKQGVQILVPTLLKFDTATGQVTETFALDTNGPLAWRNGKVFVGGARPVLLDAPKMTVRARIDVLDNMITSVTLHPTKDLFVMGGDGGATSFVDDRGVITATLVSTANFEWLAAAQDGTYRSSIDGARAIAWSFASPLEGFSFERFAARSDKPNLGTGRLWGDPSTTRASLARPPRMSIENVDRGVLQTPDRSLALAVNAISGSRVDRVRAFVDGRPVVEHLVCAREGRANLTIPLHAGQNRVGIVAYDAAGQASNTQNIDVVSTSVRAEKPNLHVLAIGVSQYPNMSADRQLEFADDDARSVAESFRRYGGHEKPFANVFTTVLLDEKVSVQAVEEAIAGLRSVRPDDLVVVFFAGHGAKLAEGKMVFMTHQAAFTRSSAETHGLGWDKIQTGLSRVRGRVLMMLDACHSGYLTTEIVAPNEDLARQLTAENRAGVFIFSAARGSQYSYEVPVSGMSSASRGLELAWGAQKPPRMSRELQGGHGLFTSALLEALEGDAPDRDRSGATEVGELVDYVTERVRAASNGQQTPWVARREMFGEFFVVPTKK